MNVQALLQEAMEQKLLRPLDVQFALTGTRTWTHAVAGPGYTITRLHK